ncbi:MAG: FHA domain-containing protein [Eubacterium sp.]|nr:FHA domain-containing protein [Eubacterium sp.]
MFKTEYSRTIQKSSLLFMPEKDCGHEKDSIEMFHYNKIPYFLCMKEVKKDTGTQFRYDITGRRSLEQLLEYKTLDCLMLQKIITSFDQACLQAENYMLSEHDIVLKPEYVFAENDTEQMSYCYLPGNQEDICVQFQAFMEYLLKCLNHNDKQALQLAYGVYQKVVEQKTSLHQVLANQEKLLAQQPSDCKIYRDMQQNPGRHENIHKMHAGPDMGEGKPDSQKAAENRLVSLYHKEPEWEQAREKQNSPEWRQVQENQKKPEWEQEGRNEGQPECKYIQENQKKPEWEQEGRNEGQPEWKYMHENQKEPDMRMKVHNSQKAAENTPVSLYYKEPEWEQAREKESSPEWKPVQENIYTPYGLQNQSTASEMPVRQAGGMEPAYCGGEAGNTIPAGPKQKKEKKYQSRRFKKKEKQLSVESDIQDREKTRKKAADRLRQMLLNKIYTDRARHAQEETVFEADAEEEPETGRPTVCLMPETDVVQNQFVYQGADRTRDFSCSGQKLIVGSDKKESDICIPVPMISRVHARIEIGQAGTFLEDMNSTNGTHVNGELLQYRERRMLQKGDIISMAGESYSFH